MPDWRNRIVKGGQVSAVEARENVCRFTDNRVLESLVKAVLSNSTDWSKVERVLPELNGLFHEFGLNYYARLAQSHIDDVFMPWFKAHSAGGLTMRRDLKNLIGTAQQLCEYSQKYGSVDNYFALMFEANKNNAIALVEQLGSATSRHKLPAMGIPIAAEAMKNIGYDVAKPDRHINRATGCFKLVDFSKWDDRSDNKPPQPKESELIEVMRKMDHFAKAVNV